MRKRRFIIFVMTVFVLTAAFPSAAFAVTESEVAAQVAAQGRNTVAGNVFIWFLCAIAFLKISQKIDSFMSSLGINVGHTGGSMMAEAVIAARGISAGKNLFGSFAGRGSRSSSGSGSGSDPGGTAGSGSGFMAGGLAGAVGRKVQSGAASAAAGQQGDGVFSGIGSKVFQSSLNKNGDYANNVIGAVAHGNVSRMGTITGDQAGKALQSYMDIGGGTTNLSADSHIDGDIASVQYSSTENSENNIIAPDSPNIPVSPAGTAPEVSDSGADIPMSSGAEITDGGSNIPTSAHRAEPYESPAYSGGESPVRYSQVEIGGGRITGYEQNRESGSPRQFAMYSAEQYTKPDSRHDTLTAADGSKWYRQYAQNAVEKTPYQAPDGGVAYNEKLVQKLPPAPHRKDRA